MKETHLCLPNNITAEQFLTEYWQKKPLLIKNGLPSLANFLEPDDVLELALADEVSARLLTQDNDNPNNWNVECSPFADDLLDKTASTTNQWTVLVQNLEQWSLEIAQMWQQLSFLPQWQQDDIMVSYAPKASSVGMHYDEFDVFLAQGYGRRRWKLGKFCDENTEFQPNQPLKLITDMGEIIFDEILEPGDVLYVPPRLSHFGVAEDDCLTFSFGLRRPSPLSLFDTLVDEFAQNDTFKLPLVEQKITSQEDTVDYLNSNACISSTSIQHIKDMLIQNLQSDANDALIQDAIAKLLSNRRFELVQDEEEFTANDLLDELSDGAMLLKEPAVKIIYTESPLQFYCQGEKVETLSAPYDDILKRLAIGEQLSLAMLTEYNSHKKDLLETLVVWYNKGWVTLETTY